ncbi:hypothetical protein QBC43DRAFT_331518 [Cladorrhinum sp. PSN259]|nr:hypothetical protein QBC43DRAFT_331518 [Cladorrhinum sp. PSN259]
MKIKVKKKPTVYTKLSSLVPNLVNFAAMKLLFRAVFPSRPGASFEKPEKFPAVAAASTCKNRCSKFGFGFDSAGSGSSFGSESESESGFGSKFGSKFGSGFGLLTRGQFKICKEWKVSSIWKGTTMSSWFNSLRRWLSGVGGGNTADSTTANKGDTKAGTKAGTTTVFTRGTTAIFNGGAAGTMGTFGAVDTVGAVSTLITTNLGGHGGGGGGFQQAWKRGPKLKVL